VKIKRNRDQVRELVVIGAIMNDNQICHAVSMWQSQYQEDLFLSQSHERIVSWAVDHYREKKGAPGAKILYTTCYEPWEEESGGTEKCELVSGLMERAQEAYKAAKFHKDQLFDLTEDVLRRQQVLIASDRVGGSSSAKLISDIVPGAVAVSLAREPEYDNFFENPEVARNAEASIYPVFSFKDDVVNAFFDDTFAPATFTTFAAPEKRGKSQWLLECTIAALTSKKKVLYFDAGDMTEDQIFTRYAARMLKRPFRGSEDVPSSQLVFTDLYMDGDSLHANHDEIEHTVGITQKQFNKVKAKCASMFKGKLFTRNFPRGTLAVDTMRSILDNLSMRGIGIDVVIVDYADILRPSKSKYSDNRHAITEIWGDMRTLSMSYGIALITATQTDAATYDNEIGQSSFTESKTKNAFISAEIGIDPTEFEGVFKLKYVFRRSGSLSKFIYVASDLATYRPAMMAVWGPKAGNGGRKMLGKFRKKDKP
jgi:hypothetical protein